MVQRERMQQHDVRTVAGDLVEELGISAAQGGHDQAIVEAFLASQSVCFWFNASESCIFGLVTLHFRHGYHESAMAPRLKWGSDWNLVQKCALGQIGTAALTKS